MPNSSSVARRLEAASIITINNGAFGAGGTTTTLLLKTAQSFKWERGGYEELLLMDRDVIVDFYRGKAMCSKLSGKVTYTGAQAATDLYQLLTGVSATGLMKYSTWVFKIPPNSLAITGEIITFGKVVLPNGQPKFEEGAPFDTMSFDLIDAEVEPVFTTY